MAGRNNWTREQTMMAFALYRILPSGKWDKRNPTVQRLADHIRRSPSAVALKLGNLASLDENRTTKELTNCSRLDRENMGGVRGTRRRPGIRIIPTAGIGVERSRQPSSRERRFRRGADRLAADRVRPSGLGHATRQPAVFPQHAHP